jgi:aspartyl/asparaginyl beta-hydroxylase (cupin superfamily)
VSEHTDKGDYLSTVRRFHIPIITNDLVSYTVNGERVHMKQGECWEINNLKSHSVLNESDTDRVHLLIDIFPIAGPKSIDIINTDDV